MIRIIGGMYKGRRLKLVPSPSVRPMQDKVKGSLFNILHDRLRGSVCLDGFAGTGSIGLEALSRGAELAVFVDEFYPSVRVIRLNVAKCGAEEKAVVLHKEFNRAVIDLAKKGVRFDVVFLDPPYKLLEERNPLRVIRKRGILKPDGLIVMRHHGKVRPRTGDFQLQRSVRLGDDVLSFFAPSGPTAEAADLSPESPPGGASLPSRNLSRKMKPPVRGTRTARHEKT